MKKKYAKEYQISYKQFHKISETIEDSYCENTDGLATIYLTFSSDKKLKSARMIYKPKPYPIVVEMKFEL